MVKGAALLPKWWGAQSHVNSTSDATKVSADNERMYFLE